MRRRFVTLDVFTDTRFTGNPLAVVLEPQGLETGAMQSIAREFNLSETVFVFPPADPGSRARLRIFTPGRELPFAGHPTIGTAVLLGILDGGGDRAFILEEQIGPVPCRASSADPGCGRAEFDIPRLPIKETGSPDVTAMAAALGLSTSDIGLTGFETARWSAGNPFTFVPIGSLDAMARCAVDVQRFNAAFGAAGHAAAFCFCEETRVSGNHFHARMFAPGLGVLEDPATGSAVAAFSGYLSARGGYADGDHLVRIEQGYEMGRPSLIELTLRVSAGALTGASIAGDAVIVMEGTIDSSSLSSGSRRR
jgi:trans-2,3-dihydro-3-hydroxyanthranilate isomerase